MEMIKSAWWFKLSKLNKILRDQPDEMLKFAAIHNDFHLAHIARKFGADNFDEALEIAAMLGHVDFAGQMIAAGAIDINTALARACECGNGVCVKFFIERGATACVSCMKPASAHF